MIIKKAKRRREQLASIRRLQNIKSVKIEYGKLVLRTKGLPLLRRMPQKPRIHLVETRLVIDLDKMAATTNRFRSLVSSPEYPDWSYLDGHNWKAVNSFHIRHDRVLDAAGRLCIGEALMKECREALYRGDLITVALSVMLVVNGNVR